jgi:hypothetical protein
MESAVICTASENFSSIFAGEALTVLPSFGVEPSRCECACAVFATKHNTAAMGVTRYFMFSLQS